MGRRYLTHGDKAAAATTISVLGITSTTAVRPGIYDMLLSVYDTPADAQIMWTLQRHTAAGTATAFTPIALDPGDPSASASSGATHTVEPTYTASAVLWRMALNIRASHRWIADPMGQIRIPATANNGATIAVIAASSVVLCKAMFHFEE